MDQFSHDPNDYAACDDDPQRGGARDSLFLSAQLTLAGMVEPRTVRVRNLSPGGLMAEYAGRVAIGDAVTVDVRGIGATAGRIAWIAEGRLGIAFDQPVNPRLARKPVTVAPRPALSPARRKRTVI